MCSHVLTDDETEKNVSCYRHCCFDLTGDYTLTRKHRENRETIKTTASDVCLLCPHQMSFSSNFSWAVLALHVFVLVRHPGKVDAEQHFVGTRLDFPFSTCMNILILNYCLKYFDHFCLISLYTVQYMSLLPKNLQVRFFFTCPRLFSDNCPGKTRSLTWEKLSNLDSISMRSRQRTLKYPASSRFQFVSLTWKKDIGNILENIETIFGGASSS